MIGKGYTLAEIADKLYRSQKTIQTHRLSLGRKLGVGNRVELARIAIQTGLSPLGEADGDAGDTAGESPERDMSDDLGRAWRLMHAIEAAIPAVGGPAFFQKLVHALAQTLGVRSAGISEPDHAAQSFHTIAMVHDGRHSEEVVYPINGSPCAHILQRGALVIHNDVQRAYPEDKALSAIKSRAFIGVRLNDNNEQPLGVLWLAHDQPLEDTADHEQLLQLCARRVAPQLHRWRLLDKVRESQEELEARVEQRTEELLRANEKLARTVEERTLTQKQLVEDERRFHTLVELMSDGFSILDRQGKITYANAKYCQMLGRSKAELLGQSPSDYMTPQGAKSFEEQFQARFVGGADRYCANFLSATGEEIPTIVSPRAIFNKLGEFDGSYAVISEMTPPQA